MLPTPKTVRGILWFRLRQDHFINSAISPASIDPIHGFFRAKRYASRTDSSQGAGPMVGRSLTVLWRIALALMVLKWLADLGRDGHNALVLAAVILPISIAVFVRARGSARKITPGASAKADQAPPYFGQLPKPPGPYREFSRFRQRDWSNHGIAEARQH